MTPSATPNDPLANLHDIHLPPAPSWWPPAPGWWLVAIIVLLLAYFLVRKFVKHLTGPKRAALAALDQLVKHQQQTGDERYFISQLSQLLRRAALARFAHHDVASLNGDAWLQFLDRTGKTYDFTLGAGAVLGSGPYAPTLNADVKALSKLARHWLNKAL